MNRQKQKLESAEKSKKIYEMYMHKGIRQKEIAKEFGLSRQRINQIIVTVPGYVSRRKAQLYVETYCGQCGEDIKVRRERAEKSKSKSVFCSRKCFNLSQMKHLTKAEKNAIARKRIKERYHADEKLRIKMIARSRAWLEKKKQQNPEWYKFYLSRMNIATKKYINKRKANG